MPGTDLGREIKTIQRGLGLEEAGQMQGFKNTCKIITQGGLSLMLGAGEGQLWEVFI